MRLGGLDLVGQNGLGALAGATDVVTATAQIALGPLSGDVRVTANGPKALGPLSGDVRVTATAQKALGPLPVAAPDILTSFG